MATLQHWADFTFAGNHIELLAFADDERKAVSRMGIQQIRKFFKREQV